MRRQGGPGRAVRGRFDSVELARAPGVAIGRESLKETKQKETGRKETAVLIELLGQERQRWKAA
jgi:hypothetical protein